MEIELHRRWHKQFYIIGNLIVNGSFLCNTLEPSLTRLPYPAIQPGRYQIRMQWSRKFKAPRAFLQDIPARSGIMIHEGNKVSDTLGCILVGDNTFVGQVLNSRLRLKAINQLINDALKAGEQVFISIS